MSATSRWSRSSIAAAGREAAREPTRESARSGQTPVRIDSVEVTWSLARSAVNGSAPGGGSRMLTMTLSVQSLSVGSPEVTVALADSKSAERTLLHDRVRVSGEVIPDIRGHVHVEIPGWLHATLGPGHDGEAWRLVYARTPLLDTLGVPGGRAEPTGVRVTTV